MPIVGISSGPPLTAEAMLPVVSVNTKISLSCSGTATVMTLHRTYREWGNGNVRKCNRLRIPRTRYRSTILHRTMVPLALKLV